jgi:hypothetical protein
MDVAKRLDPNGNVDKIVEALEQQNEILTDMTWRAGNQTGGHRTTVRTGISEPTWRKFYGSVQPTRTTTAQITATCGMLEDYSEVDAALVEIETDPAAFRLSEDIGKMQGFGQKVSAENGDNVILGDSDDDNCLSIWLVVWGENAAGFGIVPRNSKAGWQMTDKGKVTKESSEGLMEVYRTHYRWDLGLCIRDWRYVVRIANIEVDALTKGAATGDDLIDLLTQAIELPPSLSAGRPVFYANRKAKSFLRRQIANKVAASTLAMDTVAGKHVLSFDGIPFRRVDSLLNTEDRIV